MSRLLIHSRLGRVVSAVLVAGQVLIGVPVAASASPALPPTQVPLPAPQVTVNRTVPTVTPPPAVPVFSARPSVEEIGRARVFAEPLVPVGGEPGAAENAALAKALLVYHQRTDTGSFVSLALFLERYPASPWRASLLANLGTQYRLIGANARALEAWDQAWRLAREATDRRERAVADYAVGEWLSLAASFGQVPEVTARLEELTGRAMSGTAAVRVAQARETIGLMQLHPEAVIASGPQALLSILAVQAGPEAARAATLTAYQATPAGTSLAELESLAQGAGLRLRAAFRAGADEIPVPSVVHWRVGHYAAVVERAGGAYRVVDQGRVGSYWMRQDTLLSESSGYFLVGSGAPRDGWQEVDERTAATVVGHSCPEGPPSDTSPPDDTGGSDPESGDDNGQGPQSCGMARYTFDALTASLLVTDTPVACDAPRGPGVPFTLSYRHREPLQPQIFTYSNLGPKWTFAWLRFVQEQPALGQEPSHVWVQLPRGGRDVYVNPDPFGVYPAHRRTRARLVKVSESPVRYEVRYPDGRVEVYNQGDGGPSGQRRVFLTQLIDPRGQALTFTWDAQLRLVAITNAIGQVTTLEYDDPGDALKITAVEDPFGRRATFTYNPAGQLASITDTLGLTSSFGYGPNDFISTLTTPYGTTSFRHEANALTTNSLRWIEATDPLGGTEHLEFQWETPTLAATDPANEVPTGFAAWNANLDHYNAVHWDRRGWREGPGDVTKAVITHWLLGPEWPGATPYSVNIPHSVKRPLEARVWYAYPGQATGTEDEAGWWQQASRVGRVLDDGTSQITEATYNDQGSLLAHTDPLGRQTSYSYDANGVDLLTVRQTTSGMNELLAAYGSYTALHQPQTLTDAAGETTALSYNAAGQVLTVTNPKNETTTYGYDTDGRLTSVTGPVTGATTTMTYDGYGRVRTVTGPDGYTVTVDYDVADRLIRLTYPDGTYRETVYDRLDVARTRDRLGRWTYTARDARRHLVSTRDPAGRVVRQEWGADGSLDALVDANGNATRWERDLQGRVTQELRADSRATVYTYEDTTSRLESVTDAKQQVTTYGYDVADAVTSITFTNAEHTTPTVAFTYDAAYGRLATMVDGTGTTTYAYHAVTDPPSLGAGQLASVDGPLTDDTITYTYDELGRAVTRAINGAANTVTWAYDALGRTTTEQNVLGTFANTFDGTTGRLATVTYPNGQTSAYSYDDNQGDRRLQTIHHQYPNTNTLSKFDYTYDAVGNVLTWRQQADTDAVVWDYGYDAADQLVAAVKKSTDPTPQVLQRLAYAYDPAGNRTLEQIDDAVTLSSHNDVNELVSQAPGGSLRFEGTLDEPGTVTIQAKPATVTAGNAFGGTAPVTSGTNTVTIAARDPSGNERINEYEVDISGSGTTFTYDDNGNLTSDGTRTFEWDARNQLIAVNVGTHRSEFTYDGVHRRTQILEKENGQTQSVAHVLWCGPRVCEQRAADGQTVARRVFLRGEQVSGNARFFATDHLGTVREVTDGTAALMARYDFDPWGRRSLVAGTDVATVGFTRHEWQGWGDLWVTRYRAYDPQLARWLSEDPIGLRGGLNYYGYVQNNPVRFVDPDGREVLTLSVVVTAAVCAAAFTVGTLTAVVIGNWLYDELTDEDTLGSDVLEDGASYAHKTRIRKSTKQKHEEGESRAKQDKGGEKADWPGGPRRPPRKPPSDWEGPWPPKNKDF